MPKLDLSALPASNATGYPAPYAEAVAGRWVKRVGTVAGLEDFGAAHVVLAPGAWSSQRHWHEEEDELVVMLSGEAVLIDEGGRTPMRSGDIAVFPKGDGNGHHIVNESAADCMFLAIGKKVVGPCHYPDIDMRFEGKTGFTRRDGLPF